MPTKAKRAKVERHYSGNHSKRFWDRVKRIENESDRETAYMLGVVLQEQEERILHFIETARREAGNGRRGR